MLDEVNLSLKESPKGPWCLTPDHVQGVLTVASTMWELGETIQGALQVPQMVRIYGKTSRPLTAAAF